MIGKTILITLSILLLWAIYKLWKNRKTLIASYKMYKSLLAAQKMTREMENKLFGGKK